MMRTTKFAWVLSMLAGLVLGGCGSDDEDPAEIARPPAVVPIAPLAAEVPGVAEPAAEAVTPEPVGDVPVAEAEPTPEPAAPDDAADDAADDDDAETGPAAARACLQRGDQACVVRALRGNTQNEQQEGMLIEAQRAMGRSGEARRLMGEFVQQHPNSPRSAVYRQLLDRGASPGGGGLPDPAALLGL